MPRATAHVLSPVVGFAEAKPPAADHPPYHDQHPHPHQHHPRHIGDHAMSYRALDARLAAMQAETLAVRDRCVAALAQARFRAALSPHSSSSASCCTAPAVSTPEAPPPSPRSTLSRSTSCPSLWGAAAPWEANGTSGDAAKSR